MKISVLSSRIHPPDINHAPALTRIPVEVKQVPKTLYGPGNLLFLAFRIDFISRSLVGRHLDDLIGSNRVLQSVCKR